MRWAPAPSPAPFQPPASRAAVLRMPRRSRRANRRRAVPAAHLACAFRTPRRCVNPTELADKQMMKLRHDHEQIWRLRIDDRPVDLIAPTRAPMPDWAVDALTARPARAGAVVGGGAKQLVASSRTRSLLVDHLVACLHVAASSQQGPVTVFNQLFTSANMPSPRRAWRLHPDQGVLLLHDASVGPTAARASATCRIRVRTAPRASCSRSTRDLTKGQPLPDLWISCARPTSAAADAAPPSAEGPRGSGCCSRTPTSTRCSSCAGRSRSRGRPPATASCRSTRRSRRRQGVKVMVRRGSASRRAGRRRSRRRRPRRRRPGRAAPRPTRSRRCAACRLRLPAARLRRATAPPAPSSRATRRGGTTRARSNGGALPFFSDGSRRTWRTRSATAHFLRGSAARHASKATLLQIDLLKRLPTKVEGRRAARGCAAAAGSRSRPTRAT